MLFPASASCTTHHDNLSHDWRTALLVPVTSRPRLNTLTRPLIIHPVTHVLSAIGVGLSALTIPLVTLPLTPGEFNNALPSLTILHHASRHSNTHHLRTSLLVSLTSRPRENTLTRHLIIHPVTHILPPIGVALSTVTVFLAVFDSTLITVPISGDHKSQ